VSKASSALVKGVVYADSALGGTLKAREVASGMRAASSPLATVGSGLGIATNAYSTMRDIRSGQYANAGFDFAQTASSAASLMPATSALAKTAVGQGIGVLGNASGALTMFQTTYSIRGDLKQGHVLQGIADSFSLVAQGAAGTAGALSGVGFSNGVSAATAAQGAGQMLADHFLVPIMEKQFENPNSWLSKATAWLPQ
jgi:hypothetical protein